MPHDWRQQLGVDRQGMRFFSSLQDIRRHRGSLTSAHATETAWRRMELDGVIALGDSPGIYIKETSGFDYSAEDELHRKLWLHATAPLLLVIDPTQVRVYSSRPKITKTTKDACIETLSRTSDALHLYNLFERVQLGEYFETHKKSFYRDNAIDRHFKKQLNLTRSVLIDVDQRISLAKIHSLLVHSILLRYLEDRKLLTDAFFDRYTGTSSTSLYDHLRKETQNHQAAFAHIYSALASVFGIAEFEDAQKAIQEGPFRSEHFTHISDFLSGHSVGTGQLALGSWHYDLSMIPVELVSAVYQEFVSHEVEDAKRSIGLVATPRNLAELVLNSAFESWTDDSVTPTVLDPACGSGIFLVGCFNRLAASWCSKASDSSPFQKLAALKEILRTHIVGVELQPTAQKLAQLNLLHALLGHFTDSELEHIIKSPAKLKRTAATTIIQGNYLQTKLTARFDIIVGNPPWSKDSESFGTDWPRERPVPQRGNLVYGFAWKTLDHLAESGDATLLLDAKAMLASPPARRFTAAWFKQVNVQTIINFSDLRDYLFEDRAGRPAALFRYRFSRPELDAKVRYVTPYKNPAGKRGGVLDVRGARVQLVRYSEILRAAADGFLAQMWRIRLYGTGRDLSLVERLGQLATLKDLINSSSNAACHQGFNRHGTYADPIKRKILREIPFLPTDAPYKWRHSIESDSTLLRKYGDKAHETDEIREWPSDSDDLFCGPRVVWHHTPARNPAYIQAAYTDTDFAFHKEIHAIYNKDLPADFLKFIAAVLSSDLGFYFLFQTSLSWGIESIPQLRNVDVQNLPMPDWRDVEEKAALISQAARLIDATHASKPTDELVSAINSLVFDYFDLDDWERDLVSDCVETVAPNALSSALVSWPTTIEASAYQYTVHLSEVLSGWLSGRDISGTAYVSKSSGTGLVVLSRFGKGGDVEVLGEADKLNKVLAELRENLVQAKTYGQDLMLIEEDNLYITKSLVPRNWTKSAAINDADHIMAVLMTARRS